MAEERGVVAPKKREPTDVIGDFSGASSKAAEGYANQEKGQPQSRKFRDMAVDVSGKYNEGNQVKTKPSDKGTNVVGRPAVIGQAGRKKLAPATENPDGQSNRPGKYA